MSTSILILTALQIEKKATMSYLSNEELVSHPETGTIYSKGIYKVGEKEIQVYVGCTNQTNVNAALETERALSFVKPTYVFFVGVAGGLKDVKVGDIVIGTDVYGYERGKTKGEDFLSRPQFGASSYQLEQMAVNFSNSQIWKEKMKSLVDQSFSTEIDVYSGTIASGEKVDSSIESDLHQFLQKNASHALAIEMEGLGFLEVCRMRPTIKSLLIRGISDLVGDKKEMDGKGSQPYASKNASAFLFELINLLDFSDDVIHVTVEEDLREVMCKLYPGGLRDNGIWITSGGDLSMVNLQQNAKGQWTEAIRLIENGGGGNISFESLITKVSKEYPNNQDIIEVKSKVVS